MAFRSHYISEEKAKGARKVLRWIKDQAPRKREREEAASLLRVLEGVRGGSRQVILSRGQEDMLAFVLEAFPVVEPTQLSLLSPQEEILLNQAPGKEVGEGVRGRPGQTLPEPTAKRTKPILKSQFTEEEKEARRRIGLSSTPSEIPVDESGTPLRSKIADMQDRISKRDRQFGKAKEASSGD